MKTNYVLCGSCGWYGKESDTETRTSYQTLEVWGAKVHKPDYDAVCPECHADDFSEAPPPCERCESVPAIEGSPYCAACDFAVQKEEDWATDVEIRA